MYDSQTSDNTLSKAEKRAAYISQLRDDAYGEFMSCDARFRHEASKHTLTSDTMVARVHALCHLHEQRQIDDQTFINTNDDLIHLDDVKQSGFNVVMPKGIEEESLKDLLSKGQSSQVRSIMEFAVHDAQFRKETAQHTVNEQTMIKRSTALGRLYEQRSIDDETFINISEQAIYHEDVLSSENLVAAATLIEEDTLHHIFELGVLRRIKHASDAKKSGLYKDDELHRDLDLFDKQFDYLITAELSRKSANVGHKNKNRILNVFERAPIDDNDAAVKRDRIALKYRNLLDLEPTRDITVHSFKEAKKAIIKPLTQDSTLDEVKNFIPSIKEQLAINAMHDVEALHLVRTYSGTFFKTNEQGDAKRQAMVDNGDFVMELNERADISYNQTKHMALNKH